MSHASGLATASGVGAILLWSTTVALARSLSEDLGPITAGSAVYSLSAALSVSYFLIRSRSVHEIIRLPIKYLVGCGALFVSYMTTLFLAIGWADGRQQTLEIGLINYLWPILTLVFSTFILNQRRSWVLMPATVLSMAGVFLVINSGTSIFWDSILANVSDNPAAYALALAAAIFWALYSTLTRKWAGAEESGAIVFFLTATATVLTVISFQVEEPRQWSAGTLMELLLLGSATFVAYSLWDNAMRNGNILFVAALSYLTPLLSTVFSSYYLGVTPGILLWIGCVALVAGSFLSWRSVGNR